MDWRCRFVSSSWSWWIDLPDTKWAFAFSAKAHFLLHSVGFYVTLSLLFNSSRHCAVKCRWSSSLPVSSPEEFDFLSSSGRYECFYINGPKEESIMDVLNIVFSVLNLLATVIIGVLQVTWMISKDVFRNRPRAKHYSCNKKDWPPKCFPKQRSIFFD